MGAETTTRQEHLNWCKRRALEIVDAGDPTEAIASMMSDLGSHAETVGHVGIELGMRSMMAGFLTSSREVRKWITGFN